MKWIWIAISFGALLPKEHTAARRVTLHQPSELVYRAIADAGNYPKWSPPRRFLSRIADANLPFGGTWTYVSF